MFKDWRLNPNQDKFFFIQSDFKTVNPLYFIDNKPLQRQKEGKELAIIIIVDLKFHKQLS